MSLANEKITNMDSGCAYSFQRQGGVSKSKSGHSQAFEKPGQAQATWPANLSFVSPNPVTIQYLPINIAWASGGPSRAK